jgi:hypothetical protein
MWRWSFHFSPGDHQSADRVTPEMQEITSRKYCILDVKATEFVLIRLSYMDRDVWLAQSESTPYATQDDTSLNLFQMNTENMCII